MTGNVFFWSPILVTLGKCISLAIACEWMQFTGWAIVGLWFISIGHAYKAGLDIPMVGPFEYKDGTNQAARTFAVASMTAIFFTAAALG